MLYIFNEEIMKNFHGYRNNFCKKNTYVKYKLIHSVEKYLITVEKGICILIHHLAG